MQQIFEAFVPVTGGSLAVPRKLVIAFLLRRETEASHAFSLLLGSSVRNMCFSSVSSVLSFEC